MIDGMGMLRLQSSKKTHFDVVVVGSGFGSLFFLDRYLARRPNSRILLLERGRYRTHAWQLEQMQNSAIAPEATFRGREGQKPWKFTIGLGGGLNCWYATAPRLHPHDFQLRSRYGVGRDWPLSYDELEPYYVAAEKRMSVSGGEEMAQVLPRSEAFP